jgi:hypothetical protein
MAVQMVSYRLKWDSPIDGKRCTSATAFDLKTAEERRTEYAASYENVEIIEVKPGE